MSRIFLKYQKFINRDLQSIGNIKQRIQRHRLTYIRRFNMTDKRRCSFDLFSELLLGQPPQFAVVCDLQPKQ